MSAPAGNVTVDFGPAHEADGGSAITERVAQVAGSRWALVEYGPGAARAEWCTDGHRGYVLQGAIEYEFADGAPALAAAEGQGFVLAAGTGHRGSNRGARAARLFLIDDPD